MNTLEQRFRERVFTNTGDANSELEKLDRKFKGLLNASAQIAWTADKFGNAVEDSPTWRAFTGQSYQEWMGRGGLNAIHPDHQAAVKQLWQNAIQSGEKFETTYLVKRFDGEWRWMRARAIPLRLENDELDGWIGLNDDITEFKITEESLREREELFTTVTETLSDFVWVADAQAQVFFWNRAWYAYTGFTPEESMGFNAATAIREDVRNQILSKWIDAIANSIEFDQEIPLKNKSGDYRWFSAHARPVKNSNGEILRWAGVMSDIDDLKISIDHLKKERELREKFVASLTHDLRNPLSTAKMAIEICADQLTLNEKQRNLISIFTRSANRIEEMVSDLLNANSVQVGNEYPIGDRTVFDLGEMLKEVGVRFEKSMNIKIQTSIHGPLIGEWSRKSLARVIENLVNNAIKYGDTDKPISLGAKSDTEKVTFWVHNWGNAIPLSEQQKLFDFLTRSSTSKNRDHVGWGIGLTLVKRIVEAHGGKVTVDSSVTRGTTFEVSLPR